ncbi:MAG: aminodeoxychorismate lyase [Microbacteriaceae bacterium]
MRELAVFMLDVLPAGTHLSSADYAATVHRTEPGAATLRVTDLGAARGDGVFETLGVVTGHPQSVEAHLARLAGSAALLALPEPNLDQWRVAVELAAAVLPTDKQGGLKLVLTRGIESTGTPTGWITASIVENEFAERREGIRVVTLERGYPSGLAQRAPWLLAGAKTLSYAVNMAARREAVRRGADDAIFISSDGYVMEAPTATVVVRRGDTFCTPRTDIGILPGTSQLALFDFYQRAGFRTEEAMIALAELAQSDGVWLVSSVRLAAGVTQIDGARIGYDQEMTDRMNQALLSRDA